MTERWMRATLASAGKKRIYVNMANVTMIVPNATGSTLFFGPTSGGMTPNGPWVDYAREIVEEAPDYFVPHPTAVSRFPGQS